MSQYDDDDVTKTYLGDQVYVQEAEDGTVVLTTENGIRATNTIYLETTVLAELLRWVRERSEEPV